MSFEKKTLGHLGEDLALDLLKKEGYQILNQNFRTALGELDIIAKENDVICFVEVRTKTSPEEGHPLESISSFKRHKLIQTAWCYLKANNLEDAFTRFDVVAVMPDHQGQYRAELFKDAFEVGE